jgi:hypothetical protein
MALGDRRGFNKTAHNTRTRGNVPIPHRTMQPHLSKKADIKMTPADRTRMERVLSRFFIKDEISGKKDLEVCYVQSSNITYGAYSHSRNVLRIQFKQNRVYQYYNVPPKAWEVFKRVGSKGRYFYYSIRRRYPFQRIR